MRLFFSERQSESILGEKLLERNWTPTSFQRIFRITGALYVFSAIRKEKKRKATFDAEHDVFSSEEKKKRKTILVTLLLL